MEKPEMKRICYTDEASASDLMRKKTQHRRAQEKRGFIDQKRLYLTPFEEDLADARKVQAHIVAIIG